MLQLERDLQEPRLQRALRYVESELAVRLSDPAYRAQLIELGFVDAETHPEMDACNWFNRVGTLLKNGYVREQAFLEIFGRLIDRYWDLLSPSIALLRRKRGPAQYQNFEYVAARYRRWRERYPLGRYPRTTPRLHPVDPWLVPNQPAGDVVIGSGVAEQSGSR